MKGIIIEQPKTIREKVYEHLKKAIFSGDLKPGDRLVESEIGKQIGTSRTPVREALHTLEREKLITAIPRVGYVVKELDRNELNELCEIRLVLETLALRLALERDARGLAEALKDNIDRAESLLAAGDLSSFVKLDSAFHEIISRIAGSLRLQELTQSVRQYMVQYQIQSLYDQENIRRAIDGHRAVLQHVERGDRAGARKALTTHILQSKKDIAFYAKIGER